MNRVTMPKGFRAWMGATFSSELGAGTLGFALTWLASGHGPHVASGVLTLTVAPSVLFGLLGGAVADRFGPRRVMIVGALAMMATSLGLAVAAAIWTSPPLLLLTAAAVIGTIAAFHRPAVGVFPRLFVEGDVLGTAMARVGMVSQFARTIAPPLGGVLVGLVALSGVALLDLLGAAALLLTLLMIRPPLERPPSSEAATFRGIAEGLTTARATKGVPALLACVAIVAGAVIPAVLLGIPLAARERGWSASEAGLIEAGWIAGGIVSGAWFAWRGTSARVWRPMAAGPLVVAAGLGVLALVPSWTAAAVGTTLVGIGVVIFTAHVFPTYVLLAPPAMLSRFQSLLILMQLVPQLVVNPLIGVSVAIAGTGPMLAVSGLVAVSASVLVVTSRTIREFTPAPLGP